MKDIEDYLAGEFKRSKETVEAIDRSLKGVTNLFKDSFRQRKGNPRWPYEWGDSDPENYLRVLQDKPSISTQAMCITAIDELLKYWKGDAVGQLTNETIATLESHRRMSLKGILDTIEKDKGWVSSTFGKNDVFTASWVISLVDETTSENVLQRLAEIIGCVLINPGFENRTLLAGPKGHPNTAGPHALPLLRVVRAACRLQNKCVKFVELYEFYETGKNKWSLRKKGSKKPTNGVPPQLVTDVIENGKKIAALWFAKTLDRQLSFERFKDSRFDAAELVFCLEGALETGSISRDQKIVADVLEVVRKAQIDSVYWRPYRPMVCTPQGMVLLPISVEIANCLLKLLFERTWSFERTELFAKYRDTIDQYFHWLRGQRYPKGDTLESKWTGWHSENAYETDRVHIWTTSQVAIFLLHYREAIEADIKAKLLVKSGFTVKRPNTIRVTWNDVIAFDKGIAKDH